MEEETSQKMKSEWGGHVEDSVRERILDVLGKEALDNG